jgi:hypothetical protein
LPALFEFLDRAHIIIGPADIQPVAFVGLHCDRFILSEQILHEIIKAVLGIGRDKLEDPPIDRIDSHAHEIFRLRFLGESGQSVGRIDLQNSVIDQLQTPSRCDREQSITRHVARKEPGVITVTT